MGGAQWAQGEPMANARESRTLPDSKKKKAQTESGLQTIDKLSREAGVCFLVAKPKGKWSKGVEYISKEQRS